MQDPIKKLSPTEFVGKIKTKYPEYENVQDDVLLKKMLEKYPEYESKIDFGTNQPNPEQPKGVNAEVENGESPSASANGDSSSESLETNNTFAELEDGGLSLKEQASKNLISQKEKDGEKEYQLGDDEITQEALRIQKEEDKPSMWEDIKNSFSAGIDRAEASIRGGLFGSAKTAFLYTAPKETVDKYNNLESALDDDVDIRKEKEQFIADYYGRKSETVGDMLSYLSETSAVFRQQAEQIEKEVTEYDTAISQDLSDGNVGQAVRRVFTDGAASLPAMVQWMTPYTASVGAQGLMADNIGELEESGEKLEDKTILNSAVKTGAEVLMERFTAGLVNKFVKTAAVKGVPKKKIIDSAIDFVADANMEGLSEAATSAVQDASDILIQGKDGDLQETLTKAFDSYLVGFGVGSQISGATELVNMTNKAKDFVDEKRALKVIDNVVKDNSNKYKNVVDVFASPTIDASTLKISAVKKTGDILDAELNQKVGKGELTDQQAINIKKNYLESTKVLKQTKVKGLSDEKRVEVVKLVKKKQGLEEQVKNLDSSLAEPIKQQIADINTQVQEVVTSKTPPVESKPVDTKKDDTPAENKGKGFTPVSEDGNIIEVTTEEDIASQTEEGYRVVSRVKDGDSEKVLMVYDPDNTSKTAKGKTVDTYEEAFDIAKSHKPSQLESNKISDVDMSTQQGKQELNDRLQKVSDKIDNAGQSSLKTKIPTKVVKEAVSEMQEATKYANNTGDVVAAGDNYVKNSEWYKGLSESDKKIVDKQSLLDIMENAERKLNRAEQVKENQVAKAKEKASVKSKKEKPKKKKKQGTPEKVVAKIEKKLAPSKNPKHKENIRKNTGQTDMSKKISMSEKTALKEKYKNLQRGYKTGVKETLELKKEFVAQVLKDIKTLGEDIKSSDAAKLISKVNQVSEKNVDALYEDLAKLTEALQFKEAKNVLNSKKKALKKRAGSKSSIVNAEIKDVAKQLSSINHNNATREDVAKLDKLYDDLLRAYLPITNENYKAANISEITNGLNEIQHNIEQAYYDRIKGTDAELEALKDNIYKEGEFFQELMQQLGEEKAVKVKQALINAATQIAGKIKRQNFPDKYKMLLDIDLNKFSPSFIKEYGKILDNYVENGSELGMVGLLNKAKADSNTDKMKPLHAKKRRKKGQSAIDMASDLSEFFRFTFGTSQRGAVFNKLSGLFGLSQSEVTKSRRLDKIKQGYDDLKFKLAKKHPELLTPKANIQLSVIANLIQGSTNEDFAINKSRIEQELEYLKKYDSEKNKYEAVKEIYDSLGRRYRDDAQTKILENLKRTDDGRYELIKYWLDTFAETEPELRSVTEKVHGLKMAEKVDNYLPLSTMTNQDGKVVEDTAETQGSFFNSNDGFTVDPVKNIIQRTKSKKLPANRRLNLNFDSSMNNTINKVLTDVHLSEDAHLVRETSKAINNKELFSDSPETRNVIQEKINNTVNVYLNKTDVPKDSSKLIKDIERVVRTIGVRSALGGITAAPKQYVPVVAGALPRLGVKNIGLLGESLRLAMFKDVPLLDKFSISQRADSQAGSKLTGNQPDNINVSTLSNNGKITRAAMNVARGAEKVDNLVMKSLTVGDNAAAKGTWIAYYRKYLQDKGVKDVDMMTEHEKIDNSKVRQEAAAYAESMIESTQVSSDKARGSELYRADGSLVHTVFRNMFFAFQRFNVSSKVRMVNDYKLIRDSYKTGDIESRKEAATSLSATIAEQVIFTTVKLYLLKPVLNMMGSAMRAMFGVDEPDDSDEDGSFKFTQWYSEITKNLMPLSVGTFMEDNTLEMLNYMKYSLDDEAEDKTYHAWEREKKRDGTLPFWYYGNKDGFSPKILDAGIYGIMFETLGNLQDDINFSTNEEGVYKNNYGGMSEFELDSNQQDIMKVMTIIDLLTLTVGWDADSRRMLEKIKREQLQKKK